MNIEIRHSGDGKVLLSGEASSLKQALTAAAEKALMARQRRDAGFHVSYEPANMEGADLRGVDLSGVKLHDVRFRGADLRGANLRSITVYDVDLSRADLRGADLRGASLWRTSLSGANLEGADLRGALWRGGDLRDTNLRGTKMEGISLSRTELGYRNMAGEDFAGCEINWGNRSLISELLRQAADGDRGKLEAISKIPVRSEPDDDEIRWEEWKAMDYPLKGWVGGTLAFYAAELRSKPPKAITAFLPPTSKTPKRQPDKTNLPVLIEIRHRLDGAALFTVEASSLKEAVTAAVKQAFASRKYYDEGGYRPDFNTKVHLRGADLRGEDLSGADLSDADLSGSDLSGADLHGARLHGTAFGGADLEGADLRETDLSVTFFWDADLTGANFAGCRINWQSRPLVSELLRQAAGAGREKLEAIKQIPLQPKRPSYYGDEIDWKGWEAADHPLKDWMWDTLALHVVEDDRSPRWLKERPTYEPRPAPRYSGLGF